MRYTQVLSSFLKSVVTGSIVLMLIAAGGTIYAQEDAEKPQKEDLSPTEQIALAVKEMQDNITDATEQLKKVSEQDLEGKHEELKQIIELAQESSGQLKDDSELFQTLLVAIEKTKGLKEKAKEKSGDPNVEGETREKYANLANKLAKEITDLYEKKLMIGKQRDELGVTIKKLNDQSEYIALALAARDVEAANEALTKVLTSISDLNTSFLEFAENMGVEVEQEPDTQTEE